MKGDRMKQEFKLLIDGVLVTGASDMPVLNPSTGLVFAQAPRANVGQLNESVAAAKKAFPAWAARSISERRNMLLMLADQVEVNVELLACLLTCEQGKPLAQARMESMACVQIIQGMSDNELSPKVLRDDGGSLITEVRTPLGVVAAITPWNFPLALLMNKLAPALLAGNTVVVKPAPTTPLTTLFVGELCSRVFPAGVVNVITDANDLGSLLVEHPDVTKVAFTGSTATGRKVMQTAASAIKRITLELGGNDAALVLSDADVKSVAQKVFDGAMLNAGQICVAIKRVYVPNELHDAFCDELSVLVKNMIVGDGHDFGTQLGPVQNRTQYEKLKDLLEECARDGRVISGAVHPSENGYFIPPSIVCDLDDSSRIVREEQFGPILPVLRYADLDEVIRRINDSEFGLAATVWGTDLVHATKVAERIDAGTVWVNKHLDLSPGIPFRGAKQSGFGAELGRAGFEEYTQAKVINVLLD